MKEVSYEVFRICRILRTAPCYVCDRFGSIDPEKVGKLLSRRHQYDDSSDYSIRDAVLKHYGDDVVELIERNM